MSNRNAPDPTTAIAYLKAALADDVPAIELSREDSPVMRSLGNGFLVAYLMDMGNRFEYVQNRHLTDRSMTEDALHELALRNLAAIMASIGVRVVPYGNIFAVFLDGNFEASTILLDELWDESLRQFVSGDYLIAIPARDILSFCDRGSEEGRGELLQVIDRLKATVDARVTDK